MLLLVIYVFFSIISLIGLGKITKIYFKKNELCDYLYGIIGLFYLAFFITFFHLFFKVNPYLNLSILILGFIIYFKYFDFKLFFDKTFLIAIFLAFITFIGHKPHEDFGYYHLPYTIIMNSEKIILGLSNIADPYTWNSTWLNLMSAFNLPFVNYKFISAPSLILLIFTLSFLLKKIYQDISKQNFDLTFLLSTLFLFYILIKFNRFSAYGIDIPVFYISMIIIIKFLETFKKKISNIDFYFILIAVSFVVTIKLSYISMILFPLILIYTCRNSFKINHLILLSFVPVFFLVTWIFQQFLYTSCLIFPSNLTCFPTSWFNSDILNISQKLEITNKGYWAFEGRQMMSANEYISGLNWIQNWFHNTKIEISEHILAIIVIPILFLLSGYLKPKFKKLSNLSIILIFFILVSSLVLENSPLVRFSLSIIFLTCVLFTYHFFQFNKKFNTKVFNIFLIIGIFYFSLKNFDRIYQAKFSDFPWPNYVNANYEKRKSNIINVFIYRPKNIDQGWQGRLCWNTPFICTYNFDKIIVNKIKLNYLMVSKK